MGDDHPPLGDLRRGLRQGLGDIFIGKAVKAVAPDALGVEAMRDGVMVRERVMVAMKRGVEAGDLRQRRKILQQRADRRQIVGLMQRRQRGEALEARHDGGVDQDRTGVVRPAMDDPMPDGQRVDTKLVSQPGACHHQRSRNVRDVFKRIGPLGKRIAAGA